MVVRPGSPLCTCSKTRGPVNVSNVEMGLRGWVSALGSGLGNIKYREVMTARVWVFLRKTEAPRSSSNGTSARLSSVNILQGAAPYANVSLLAIT